MKTNVIFLCLIMSSFLYAQTSLLQDKGGETSLVMHDKKSISINAGDANVLLSMSFNKPKWFIGGSAKFKSTDGVANLLDGYKFNPEVGFTIYGGNYLKAKDYQYQFFFYAFKLVNTKYNLLKNDNSNTFDSKTFTGYTFTVGYNNLTAVHFLVPKDGVDSSFLWGGSANFGSVNNLDDLKSVQTFTTSDVISGSTVTTLQKDKKQGFEGLYYTETALRVNLDGYLFPQLFGGRFGVGGYVRSKLTGTNRKNDAGLGIILGEKDAPSNIVLGVLYQFNDVFNQLDSESNVIERGGINLIAGYNF